MECNELHLKTSTIAPWNMGAPTFTNAQRRTLKEKRFGVLVFMPGISEGERIYSRLNYDTWDAKADHDLDQGMTGRIFSKSFFAKMPTGKDNDVTEKQVALAIEAERNK